MRTLHQLALAGLILLPLSNTQAIELNDEFALEINPVLVSDYRASGISQTLGDPAAQLAINLIHYPSGLYAGTWTSNVDFGHDWENDDNYGTRQEVEYYAGYYAQLTDDISLDTFYTKYTYPGEGQFNTSDIQTTLDMYGAFVGGKITDDGDAEESSTAAWIGYHTVLPAEIGFSAQYEYVDYKDDVFWNADFSDSRKTYYDWEVSLTRDFADVTWGLSYIDSDLSDAECTNFSGYDDLCSATVVASASKTF
jgi:uncharacterized protein (TIGR02001 family)